MQVAKETHHDPYDNDNLINLSSDQSKISCEKKKQPSLYQTPVHTGTFSLTGNEEKKLDEDRHSSSEESESDSDSDLDKDTNKKRSFTPKE